MPLQPTRSVLLTNDHKSILIPGVSWSQLQQGPVVDTVTVDPQPVLSVQWELPSDTDLDNVVCAFHVHADDEGGVSLLDAMSGIPLQGPSPPSLPSQLSVLQLEQQMPADAAEGLVFLTEALKDKYLNAPPEVQNALHSLLAKFKDSVFKECEFPPFPPARDVAFRIKLTPGAQIPASPVHKLAPALVESLRKMIQELLQNGLIVPTSSPYAAPVLMVKKPDGSYRLCIDYRKLNAVTVKDRYQLPNTAMIFDRLTGCKFFSKLNLC